MESLNQRLHPQAVVDDLADLCIEDLPWYDPPKKESWNEKTFPSLDEKPVATPEWEDLYLNAETSIPIGDNMTRGQVVDWKCDVNCNPIDRFNQSPILDMHLH